MRLIMMGTGPFAVPTFRWLLDSPHDVLSLVTRPLPAVRTRGRAPSNPMREVAEELGVEVLAPASVNAVEARQELATRRADLLVVCDYGQILARETLAAAARGGINLHGSLLPKYRGAAPVQWAVWEGERETGVSVIHMTPQLDGGPCLVQRSIPIGADETAAELELRLAVLGVGAVRQALELLSDWDGRSALGQPQDPGQATRAPRLSKAAGEVQWTDSATRIRNQVRALTPWPGTFTHWQRARGGPLRLILLAVSLAEGASAEPPGTVCGRTSDRLLIATGDGLLSLDRVQVAGKRALPIAEFLRGHDVSVGARLG